MTDRTTVTLIRPQSERTLVDELSDIYAYRELLWVLATRSIAVRFKQSILGKSWIVIQPVLTTAIFTFVFSYLARIPSDGVPYPVFVFSGLLLWQYFSRIVVEGSGSLLANSNLITKIYFPRLIIPLTVVISAAADFFVSFVILVIMMLMFGLSLPPTLVFVPVIVILAGALGYGVSLALAPLNAVHRDVGLALPILIQIGMYLSPIIYPVSFVPANLQWLYILNPAATLLDAMRWAIVGGTALPSLTAWGILSAYVVAFLLLGRTVFRLMESTLVDRI